MSSVNNKPSIEAQHDSTTDNASSEDMKRKALIHLLQSWREGDEQEQIETLKLLQHAAEEYPISFGDTTVGV